MTVIRTDRKIREQGDGINDRFDFSFPVTNSESVFAYKIDRDGDLDPAQAPLQVDVDYTIQLLNNGNNGGTIVYTVPPTDLQDSLIIRDEDETQETVIPRISRYDEKSIERALDKLTMLVQELKETVSRVPQINIADQSGIIPSIPATGDEGNILVRDGNNNFQNSDFDVNGAQVLLDTAQDLLDLANAALESTTNISHEGVYSPATTYAKSEIVEYSNNGINETYISLAGANTANTPDASPAWWQIIGQYDVHDFFSDKILEGCFLSRVDDDTLEVSSGKAVINGDLRYNAAALTLDPVLTNSTWNDVFLVADEAGPSFTIEAVTNLASPGIGVAVGTNVLRCGSIYTESDGDLLYWLNYRKDCVEGWIVSIGNDTNHMTITVDFGVTLSNNNWMQANYISGKGGLPTNIGIPADLVTSSGIAGYGRIDSTTQGTIILSREDGGTFFSGSTYGGYFRVYGPYSF